MRVLRTLIPAILLFGLATSSSAQESDATLAETQAWISRNYKFSWENPVRMGCPFEERWNGEPFWDGCEFSWTLYTRGLDCDKSRATTTILHLVNLKDLDPESMNMEDNPGRIHLRSAGGESRIKEKVYIRPLSERQYLESERSLKDATFYVEEEDNMKYRMRTALAHAIRLCGGKHEAEAF